MGFLNFYKKIIKSKPGRLLLTPGPVMLDPLIQQALSQDMQHHRSVDFKKVLKQVLNQLKKIFKTKEDVLILSCTGTGAMEAALLNTLSPQEELLCVVAGKFGKRWKDIALAFHLKVTVIEVPWGQAVCVKEMEKHLKINKNIKAVLITACETSTATQQPVKQAADLLKNYPDILFLVDAITGLGSMEIKMDEWGIDVLIAGSQKTFWLPAGLAFISLSQKAWKKTASSKLPKYYFDLKKEKLAQQKGQTAFSSCVNLIQALSSSLNLIEKIGFQNVILRAETLKFACHFFAEALDIPLFSCQPANAVTALKIFDADSIKKRLEEKHHVFIGGGQGQLKNKILRIGHLGPLKNKDFLKALKALAFELKKREAHLFTKSKIRSALKKAESALARPF